MKNTLLSLLVICLAVACSSSPESKKVSAAELPSFEYKTFKVTSTKTVPVDNGVDTAYYLVTYPEFSDERINQYVQNNLVLDSGQSSLEQMAKEFIREYDRFYDQAEYKRTWFQETRDSVNIQTKSYIGFSSFYYAYTGGAHGNYYTWYHNYNVNTHEALSLTDLIAEKDQEALTSIAEGIFRKQENLDPKTPLDSGYFFENAKFHLPDNFILQKQGILFLYTIYEIKPYVSGETKLLMPYSAIQTLLTPTAKDLIAEVE